MKELEINCYKNIKEENCKKESDYIFKNVITNVILNICLSICSELGFTQHFTALQVLCIYYFSNVSHFILTLNQKFKIKFTEKIFLALNFILTFAQKAIKICSVISGLICNFLCACNVILRYCIILRFQKILTKLNRTLPVLFHQV